MAQHSLFAKFVGLLIGLALIIGGYCLVHFIGWPTLHRAKSSVNWPTVAGRIEHSSVVTSRDKDHKTMYKHRVEYAYTVDGQQHLGKVVWFGDDYSSNSRGSHQDVVERYPVGREVKTYYDPAQPAVACLEPGAKFSSYVLYVVGWGLCVIGALVTLNSVRAIIMPF